MRRNEARGIRTDAKAGRCQCHDTPLTLRNCFQRLVSSACVTLSCWHQSCNNRQMCGGVWRVPTNRQACRTHGQFHGSKSDFNAAGLESWFRPQFEPVRESPLDRTGVMIAAYRIAVEHKTVAEAIAEMHQYHDDWLFRSQLKRYIESLPRLLQNDPQFANYRPQPAAR